MSRVVMVATLLAFGATMFASGCAQRPGYNAYGRYQGNTSPSDAAYDRLKNSDEWYKDRGY